MLATEDPSRETGLWVPRSLSSEPVLTSSLFAVRLRRREFSFHSELFPSTIVLTVYS